MTQETTMQAEPMNVDTKDLSLAEALELAIAETRLALAEYGDRADEAEDCIIDMRGGERRLEAAYHKVDAGLDRCKAAADGLAAYSRVLEMANKAAGERLRSQRKEIRLHDHHQEIECLIQNLDARIDAAHGVAAQDRQAQHYDRRPNLKCAAWVIGLVLLGAAIEAANGLIGRLL